MALGSHVLARWTCRAVLIPGAKRTVRQHVPVFKHSDVPTTAQSETRVVAARPIGENAESGARARVLLVDDAVATTPRASYLSAAGYQVHVAVTAEQALERVLQISYDVIVTNTTLPAQSGLALLRSIRRHDHDVPVVVLTATPSVSGAAEAVELKAFRYLTLPIPDEQLESVVALSVGERRVSQEQGSPRSMSDAAIRMNAAFDRCLSSVWTAFQPIVSVQERKVFGYEALLRSTEPSFPHPGAVLDAAQRLGRLPELGALVRKLAAQDFLAAPDEKILFVNLHVSDLVDPSLGAPGAPLTRIADRVVLELTERASLEEVTDAPQRVRRLRELGFRIALDDIGAGYAGLTSYTLLEPEIVKLDMFLVRDIHRSVTKRRVVEHLTRLSQDMGTKVVAEGVETRAELETLLEIGCDLFQGFFFAKPGPAFPDVSFE